MRTFKKAKVVILPTNEKTKYLMVYSDVEKTKGKLILNGLKNDEYKEYQNFYIISDDEIKKGDWFINLQHNKIYQCVPKPFVVEVWVNENKDVCKKIIATTDSSLWRPSHKYASDVILLPQPSQQFIEKFIEEYNRGNVITDVLIEYELISNEEYFGNTVNPDDDVPYFDEKLKINPKDNTITIKKVKDSYSREEVDRMLDEQASRTTAEMLEKFKGYKSREEVIEFGNKIKEYCKNGWKSDSLHRVFFEWDKWIEENL